MHVIKRFEQALVWNPAGWLAAFSTNADRQRRLTLIGVALLLQTFTELPHDIIGAVAGQYAGLVTMVALAASLILLLYAVIAPPRAAKRNDAHLTRFVLIVGIVAASFGTMQIADAVYGSFTRVSYPNDGTTLSQNAAQLLLNGHDPYQDSSIVAALRRYQQGGEFTTPVRTGRFAGRSWLDYPTAAELRAIFATAPDAPASATPEMESHVSYPALSFLPLVPFVALGLPSVVLFTVLCLAVFAWFAWHAIAPAHRPWLVLLLLADVPMLEGVAIGESDILLMVLVFLMWLWWKNPTWSTVALGLALATKQQAWFFAAFFLIFLIQRVGWREALTRFAAAGAIFLAINAPFLLHDAHAWFAGIAAPFADPMWPLGNGLIQLARTHLLPLWPQRVYTVMMLLVLGACLLWYARVGARRYPVTALLLAMLPLWFNWRSLSTYFFFSALPMLVLWLAWQRNASHDSGRLAASIAQPALAEDTV